MQSWLTGCFKSARGGEFTPRERAKSTSQAFRLQELVGYHHYFREDLTHQGNGTGRSRVMCLRSHDSLRTELAWQDSGGGGAVGSWWAPPPRFRLSHKASAKNSATQFLPVLKRSVFISLRSRGKPPLLESKEKRARCPRPWFCFMWILRDGERELKTIYLHVKLSIYPIIEKKSSNPCIRQHNILTICAMIC